MQLHLLKDEYKLSHRADIMTLLLLCHIMSTFLFSCCIASPISERDYDGYQQNIPSTQTTQADRKNIPQLPVNFARPYKDQQQSLLIGSNWPHSSQNPVNMRHLPSNASPAFIVGQQNPQSGIMIEGSGDGPISSRTHKQQTEKFDDTEGGDDDDDDDEDGDYDERDSLDTGSGLGYDSSNSNKVQPAELIDKNIAKKTIFNESSIYHPFRLPTTGGDVINFETSTQRNTHVKSTPTVTPSTSTPPNNNANILNVPSDINTFNLDTKIQNQTSSPIKNESSNSLHDILLTTMLPPSTSIKTIISTVSPETVTQSKNILSTSNSLTTRPRLPTNHVVPISASLPSLDIGSSRNKYQESGSSTILMPNSSTAFDSNYDYEEEGEDDEPEESDSNFEDNEFTPSHVDFNNKTTSFNHTQNQRPSTTVKPTLTTLETTTTTKFTNFQSQSTKPTLLSNPLNTPASTMITHSVFSSNKLPSKAPPATPPRKESSILQGDNMDNEEDEEDEDDEDDEDEDDDEENEDNEYEDPVSERTIPELYQPLSSTLTPITTTFKPTQRPTIVTSSTVSTPNDDDDDEDEDDVEDDGNDKLDRHVNSKDTISRENHEQIPTTTPISSSTFENQLITIRPFVMEEADQQKVRTSLPILTSTEPSTTNLNTVEATVMTTVFSSFSTTKRSNEISYMTTTKTRVTTAITKKPDVPFYNNEDDADLTKQLYDKALEVYYATNRAIHAALEVVWPSTFEINSSTFEPLIAQPLLFMLTLGAAVIGLVLTMMLIVYIVSYQIQPRDDISIYM